MNNQRKCINKMGIF